MFLSMGVKTSLKMGILDLFRGQSETEEEGFESPSPEEVLEENQTADEL